jgi:hypothetical protein
MELMIVQADGGCRKFLGEFSAAATPDPPFLISLVRLRQVYLFWFTFFGNVQQYNVFGSFSAIV